MIDLSHVTAIASFVTGLLTFFAPCTFIALPTFLAYLTNRATYENEPIKRTTLITSVFFFSLGFLVIFLPIGLAFTTLGTFITQKSDVVLKLGGLIIALFGIFMLYGELLATKYKPLTFAFQDHKLTINPSRFGSGLTLPFVIGLITGFAWTACQGPILGGIITYISIASTNLLTGTLYLLLYWIGIMIPYIIAAFALETSRVFIARFAKYTPVIYKITAFILIGLGTSIAFDLTGVVRDIYEQIGYQPS